MSQIDEIIVVDDVVKKYPDCGGKRFSVVLDKVSLKISRGESVAVTGPSGCGKSTLVNLIGALDNPDEGAVVVDGVDLASMGENELARFRNNKIGVVFQLHHLLPQLTAKENVLLPLLADDECVDNTMKDYADELLGCVGLADHMGKFPSALSGGERQRVAIARALICKPDVLLADEPTGSLDETSAQSVFDLLSRINQEQKLTLLTVTHNNKLASQMARCYRLHDQNLEMV